MTVKLLSRDAILGASDIKTEDVRIRNGAARFAFVASTRNSATSSRLG